MAPEILSNKDYHYPVDVWSLGVTFYLIIANALSFPPEMSKKSKVKIKLGI